MRKRSVVAFWGFTVAVLAAAGSAMGDDINLAALTDEIQKMSQASDEMTIVWWIPDEFWSASFSQEKNLTAAQAEEFLKVVRPHTIVAVIDGTVGPFAGITYKSEDSVRATIRLVDAQGTSYMPRSDDQLDTDLKSMLQIMKPILANMLGPLGQNMHFLVFPSRTEAGARIISPREKGHFTIKLDKREFKWRLPLDALLPAKVCTGCGEACKGSWNFCPWCGTKLIQK